MQIADVLSIIDAKDGVNTNMQNTQTMQAAPNVTVRRKNISSINVFSAVAAFMVVIIHLYPSFKAWNYIEPFARTAVPFFFIRSGYFLYDDDSCIRRERIKKHTVRLLKLIVLSNLLYFAFEIINNAMNNALGEFIGRCFSPQYLAILVLFNMPEWANHLWYLNAYLYVLMLYPLILKVSERAHIYVASALLLVACIPAYSMLLPFGPLHPVLVRNFLFTGLPFFMFGTLIKKYGAESLRKLPLWIAVAAAGVLAERLFLIKTGLYTKSEMFVFVALLTVLLFVWAVKHPNFGHGDVLDRIGDKYSMYIFINHWMVIVILSYFKDVPYFAIWNPVAVCVLCVAISAGYDRIKRRSRGDY